MTSFLRSLALVCAAITASVVVVAPARADDGRDAPARSSWPMSAEVAALIAYAPCRPEGPSAADAAIADQVRPSMNGPRLGRSVNAYNISCARTITEVVLGRGMAQRAAVIAVTTAITESTLHNYTEAVDHDSLGLFQQRPSQGWGTPAQITDPVYATNAFLNAMVRKFPNNSWMSGDIGAICQAVQVSAFPDAYSREVHDAQLIVDALWSSPWTQSVVQTGDYTGDGKADIIGQYVNGDMRAWPSSGVIATGQTLFTGPGNGVLVGSGWGPGNVQRILTADFTGDGKTDIIGQYANGDMRAWPSSGVIATGQVLFTGPGNGVLVGNGWGPANVQRILTADFTGDGKADIIAQYANGDMRAWPSSGVIASGQALFTGPGNGVLVGSGWGPGNVQRILTADFTGDGKADIIAQYANGDMRAWPSSGVIASGQALFTGPGNGVLVGSGWGPGNVQRILTADFTGDGKTDIIGQYANGDMRAWPSSGVIASGQTLFTGPGNGVLVGSGWGPGNVQRILIADYTGDDKTDIIAQYANGDMRAWPSSGVIATGQVLFTGPGNGVLVGNGWAPGNVQRIL